MVAGLLSHDRILRQRGHIVGVLRFVVSRFFGWDVVAASEIRSKGIVPGARRRDGELLSGSAGVVITCAPLVWALGGRAGELI